MTIAGELLRLARAKTGDHMTVERLAELAGRSVEAIEAIESGARQPTLEEIVELVAAAGWSLRFVIREPDEQSALTAEWEASRPQAEQDAWAAEQAAWVAQRAAIEAATEQLDLRPIFTAEGKSWVELGEGGTIVRCDPDGTRTVLTEGMARLVDAARAELLASGTAVTIEELAHRHGRSRDAARRWLARRRRANDVVSVTHEQRLLIPSFQLNKDFTIKRDAAAIVQRLVEHGMDGWAIWDWAETPNTFLGGHAPSKVLEAGDTEQVRRAIDGLFQE